MVCDAGAGHKAWIRVVAPQMITQGVAQPIGLFAPPTETEWSYSAVHRVTEELGGGVDSLGLRNNDVMSDRGSARIAYCGAHRIGWVCI
jgi:hypothetical protein